MSAFWARHDDCCSNVSKASPFNRADRRSSTGRRRTTLDESALKAARRIFEECARRDAKNARCYYDLGRTDSYIAEVRDRQQDKKTAKQVLESAIVNARRSIELDDGFGDAHALLAELTEEKLDMVGSSRACGSVPKPRSSFKGHWN